NELVALAEPSLMRNSLIFTGLTFRTFCVVCSDCLCPPALVHAARPERSPLNAAGPDVTLKVALTLAPGASPANVADPCATDTHCLGPETPNWRPVTGAPVVLVKVTVVSCDEPGVNVWSPGAAVAEAGERVNRGTSYLAATTFS